MYQTKDSHIYKINKNGWLKKAVLKGGFLFAAIFLLCFSTQISAHAEKKIIKVGAIAGNSFIESYGGVYHGYGVEYLEEIAEYNDWTYEYVFDTWENCFRRLESGELDMLCNVQHTEERAEKYLYSSIPLGYDYSILYTLPDSDIYYEDYESMVGKKVGLLTASTHSIAYLEYDEKHELNSELVYFDSENDIIDALIAKKIDIAVTGSLYSRNDMKAVGRFGTHPFYCITGKDNALVMEQINDALQQIKVGDPGIEASLAEKYYGENQISSSPLFTREENEYIENRDPIRIRLMVGSKPLSYIDKERNPQGIFVNYLELLSEKSGLKFKIELSTDSMGMEEQTKCILEEDYMMLRAKRALEASGLDERLITTKPLITTQLSYVIHKDNVADTGRDDYVFAITNEMGYFEELVKAAGNNYT
ncbi:MAG: transporter substrate-binding domain-containing protein, partial [Lachnospiraceae bacterium]|nr:transporter substrate-binding domain-containing protein [Lachnospiraceae bacterium]